MSAADSDAQVRKPPRRWLRRSAIGIGIVLLVIIGVIAGGVLFREDVLQAVLEDQLAAMGLRDASFTVAHVSEDEIRIVDLRADDTTRIDRLTLQYAADELLDGKVRRVEIVGLTADLSKPDEGAIGALLRDGGDEPRPTKSPAIPPIPEILISNAKIRAMVDARPVALTVDGKVGPLDGNHLPIRMTLGLQTTEGRAAGPLKLDVGFVGGRTDEMSASGDLTLEAKSLAVGDTAIGGIKAFVPIEATLKSGDLIARLAAPAVISFQNAVRAGAVRLGPGSAALTAHIDAKLAGSIPPTATVVGNAILRTDGGQFQSATVEAVDVRVPFNLLATSDKIELQVKNGATVSLGSARTGGTSLQRTSATLRGSVVLVPASGAVSGRIQVFGKSDKAESGSTVIDALGIDLPIDYAADAKGTKLHLSRPAAITMGAAVTADGIKLDRARVEIGGTVSLSNGDEPAIVWDGGLKGTAAAAVLDGTRLASPGLDLPLRLQAQGGETKLWMTAPGKLTVRTADAGTLRTAVPISLTLNERRDPILRASRTADGNRLDVDIGARLARLVLRETGTKRSKGSITASLGPLTLTGRLDPKTGLDGRLRLTSAALSAQGQRVAMRGVDVRATAGPDGASPTARVRIGTVRRVAPASPLPPVAVTATIRPRGDLLRFATTIRTRDAPIRIVVGGTHNVKRQSGRATVTIRGLDFLPGGFQPQQLVPGLAEFKDVGGSIEAGAKLRWSGAKIDGTARISLKDIGAKTNAGAIDGLNGTVAFASLQPPSTPKGQMLTIRSIDVGPKLSGASIVFALLRDGTLAIERAEMGVAGGKLRLRDQKIDPFAKTIRTTVEIQDVELAELIGLFDIGEVQATGRLTGAIPLIVTGDTIAVEGGKLAALRGGTLRIRSQQASQVLAAGGEQVRLMLQALEDFKYETLSIDVDKSTDGDALVALRTLGHNPKVLDGRKFQINVNLQTNLDRVLAAVAQWYMLSGRALRDIVGGATLGGTKAK